MYRWVRCVVGSIVNFKHANTDTLNESGFVESGSSYFLLLYCVSRCQDVPSTFTTRRVPVGAYLNCMVAISDFCKHQVVVTRLLSSSPVALRGCSHPQQVLPALTLPTPLMSTTM